MKSPDDSPIIKKMVREKARERCRRFLPVFLVCVGMILICGAATDIAHPFSKLQVWDLKDPLLSIRWRYLVFGYDLLKLIVACLCLAAVTSRVASSSSRLPLLCLSCVSWFCGAVLAYRGGLWAMGQCHPWAFVASVSERFNLSPPEAYLVTVGTLSILFVCSSTLLVFAPVSKPQPQSAYVKISCEYCSGHIEVPADALGKQNPCPHCKRDIILAEPA